MSNARNIKVLANAMLEAFTIASFDRMLLFELDKEREHIATGSLTNIVYETIVTARREGWLKELIAAARAENPNNNALREAAELFEQEQTATEDAQPAVEPPSIGELVTLFAKTDSMSRSEDRDDIVAELRPEIRDRIRRRSAARSDIRNIIKKSLEFDSGLIELTEVLRDFEGESEAMKRIDEVLDVA